MLIGFKNKLALEYQIDPQSGPKLVGYFRMWANGKEIGNFSSGIVLGVVQYQLQKILEVSDQLIDPFLFDKNKEEAFRILHEALYGKMGDFEQVEALSIKYSCFNLKGLGESSFDGWFVFLVSNSSEQRLLWRRENADQVTEATFRAGTFEAVAREYLGAWTQESDRLAGRKH